LDLREKEAMLVDNGVLPYQMGFDISALDALVAESARAAVRRRERPKLKRNPEKEITN
jgi:hypothetical protein